MQIQEQLTGSVKSMFDFLKVSMTFQECIVKSMEIAGGKGTLAPVCRLHLKDERLISTLTDWRNEFAFAYPTQFKATPESTKKWMDERLLNAPYRMLFLVLDEQGNRVGHIGLANPCLDKKGRRAIEIDNVVRGVSDVSKGLMGEALVTLCKWAQEKFLAEEIFLRVFSDNAHAIQFYKNNAFVEESRLPLKRTEANGMISFSETTETPDANFVRMIWSPSRQEIGKSMILTAGPSISAREAYYAFDAASNGWNNKWSGYIKKFESEFASFVGAKYALSTSSCTGALHLSLLALGIGPGDEVIVPDITWVATANAVVYTGATPVFADIEEDTWCLDPKKIEALITPKTKAIMPVHLYGFPAKMNAIVAIAKKHGLAIVEDAAPAIGATIGNKKAGTFGDFGCFSFQGAKLTVTGEGGMLVTNNQELYEKVQLIWDQGRDPNKTFWINQTGWKYKMSNVQAAVGLGQLQRVETLIAAKQRIFEWYHERLKDLEGTKIAFETAAPDTTSIYWMTSIRLLEGGAQEREQLRAKLKERNVDTRPVFPAISQYPIWKAPIDPKPVARMVGNTAINLPTGVCLTEAEIDYVSTQIRALLK